MTANGGFLVTGRPDHFALPYSVIGFEYTDVIESQLKPLLYRLDGQRVAENKENTQQSLGLGWILGTEPQLLQTQRATALALYRTVQRSIEASGYARSDD